MKIPSISGLCRSVSALSVLIISVSCAGGNKPLPRYETFAEMADPTADTLSDWSAVGAGLEYTFAPADRQYRRSVVPSFRNVHTGIISGWRGEKVSAQVLLFSAEEHPQVVCNIGDFTGENDKITADNSRVRFARYVMTDEFGPGCGYRQPEDFASRLVADMLDPLPYYDLPGKSVRPVWITVDIPAAAAAGLYKAPVVIYSGGEKVGRMELHLVVSPRTLPPSDRWEYFLDLWQHPSAVARVAGVEIWSDEHFDLLVPQMKMLAGAGQKVITATLNKDPWNVQTYDPYADMILWRKLEDGTWSYDYTVFDRWVELMLGLGIDRMINCYSLLPWNNELHYFDSSSGETVTVRADPGSVVFYEMWVPFLTDFTAHLRERGWLEITCIAMDERSPRDMEYAMELLTGSFPELGISLADNHKSYRNYPDIRNLCVGADCPVDPEDMAYRRQKGLITTWYVCCGDPFPNMLTCSDPCEAVYAALYGVANGYDGFLRWAFNSWVENPLTDSRFRTWPAGDTYMVYPGARSSIRFEKLVDGIQMAEKLRIVLGEGERITRREELMELLGRFSTLDPATDWKSDIESLRILLDTI
ncbi:MAG: DUF4091 domain-containing protein [Rikenellaceae bacterium]|nr:DUF4091 domain-containing protein [Rikenellaceae bacterium]